MSAPAPARYVPLAHTAHPPGRLSRLHADQFGNGARDALHVQVDTERAAYLSEKVRVAASSDAPSVSVAEFDPQPARRWLERTLQAEHPGLLDAQALTSLDRIASALQEDVVVLQRDRLSAEPRATYLHVSLPSGWRPERLVGASFSALHAPVPEALLGKRPIGSYAQRLFDGTRLRFVWSLSPDARLDRHPARCQADWCAAQALYLRVERQLLVPLDPLQALFLIRLYRYPVSALTHDERAELWQRLEAMDAETRRYKGWAGHEATLRALLVP